MIVARAIFTRALRQSAPTKRAMRTLARPRLLAATNTRCASHAPAHVLRWASSKSKADERIEDIVELYATAQDEFDIAREETEKASIYAEEDRKAAREELTKVQEAYNAVINGEDQELAAEVKSRIGQKMRELEQNVANMEELALNQD